jgi:hypothetical protein
MAQLYPTQLVGTFDKEATNYPALLDAYQEEALAYYHQREEEVMAGWVPNQPLDSMPAAPPSLPGSAGDGVPDYYEVLGVEPEAEIIDIRTAFRHRAQETHPDRNPGIDSAGFLEVATAWEVLSDDDRREQYNAARSAQGPAAEGAALAPIDFSVLASSYESFRRRERMRELERLVFISILDNKWREHLYEMDYLREGIGLRGYGQRDPEMEYKREGYDMFQAMMTATKEEFVRYMFHVQVVEDVQDKPGPVATIHEGAPTMVGGPADAPAVAAASGTPTSTNGANGQPAPSKPAPARVTASVGGGPAPSGEFEKVGRNAPCPCGSGRKYKKCHGAEV